MIHFQGQKVGSCDFGLLQRQVQSSRLVGTDGVPASVALVGTWCGPRFPVPPNSVLSMKTEQVEAETVFWGPGHKNRDRNLLPNAVLEGCDVWVREGGSRIPMWDAGDSLVIRDLDLHLS